MRLWGKIATLSFFLATSTLNAQWTSGGNGTTYNIQVLSTMEGTGVCAIDDNYLINNDLTIDGDTLLINNATLLFADGVTLECKNGKIECKDSFFGCDNGSFAIRIGETNNSCINNTIIEKCGGITLYDAHIDITDSELRGFTTIYTYAALSLLNTTATISGCHFHDNEGSAIGSAANGSSTPKINNCLFNNNVTGNTNRPQINLGPSTNDTIFISHCTIVGGDYDKVGGVAIADLIGNETSTCAVICDNEIRDNRYGINQQGVNINSLIINNIIIDNNKETNPNSGGSGISIYGTDERCKAKLRNNIISGNLWGITSIYKNYIDMGTSDDLGGNYIYHNANNGTQYQFYNNASTDVAAAGNYWGSNEAEVAEEYIYHQPDLGESYGLVSFLPVMEVKPTITSLSSLAEHNIFLSEDIIGTIDNDNHLITLNYNDVLTEEMRQQVLTFTTETTCTASPTSGSQFTFNQSWHTTIDVVTPHGDTQTWDIAMKGIDKVAETFLPITKVSPNPARDMISVSSNTIAEMVITDAIGRQILRTPINIGTSYISTDNIKEGFYTYTIADDKHGIVSAGKLIISR